MPDPTPNAEPSPANPLAEVPGSGATSPGGGAAGQASAPFLPQPSYRPRGKIAWMDKAVRDKLNHLLLDGRPYRAAIQALGAEGQNLTVVDLCRYHKGLYRHWLREQHWLAQARVKEEAAAEHCRGLEATHLSQAAIQTTIVQ